MAKESNKRVAVIGAGVAGLVAACKLGTEGADVVVFEKDHSAGGRAKTTIKDGFHLNLGPHALYKACQTYKFLRDNDITISGAPPKLAGGLAIYREKMHSLPMSLLSVVFSGYFDLSDKIEWLSFFTSLPKLDLSPLMSVSLSDWCAHNLKQERVRQTVEAFVRLSLYASCPQKVSAGQAFRQLLLAQQGVLYLNGGWQTMIDALQHKAETKASFRFGATIEAIDQHDRGVEILVDGTREHFDSVFLCLPPDSVNSLVPGAVKAAQLIPGRIACLDVCLKRLPYPNRNFALGIDEPLYLSVHSAAAKLAPEGGALIHVGYYLSDENSAENSEARMMELLDRVQPGWRDQLVYKRFLPHMTSTNGLPLATLGGATGLPNPDLPGHPNIYVCGDYVGFDGQLVDCSTSSALSAVQSFMKQIQSIRV